MEIIRNNQTTSINLQKLIKKRNNKKLLQEKKIEQLFKSLENDNNENLEQLLLKYPHLNDPYFSKKITLNKEFFYPYDAKIKDINEEANEICYKPFTISNHQKFIKHFMSYNTPYNGLILYHGLGSGKTCSAIGVTENMRRYLEMTGNTKSRTIIVASPNVQENFKLQLFDHTKLIKTSNGWEFKDQTCAGQNFLDDLKHLNLKKIGKETLLKKVRKIIKSYYVFMGYIEFANYIEKQMNIKTIIEDEKQIELLIKRKLNNIFKNRLVVIDEIHNIRLGDDSIDISKKKVASNLFKLVNYVDTMKLLFLSATPMYNDVKEIVFLLNILNINDKRAIIRMSDIFDKNDNLKVKNGKNIGKELLIQKSRGYISYVRGENPYSFPFGIYPKVFNIERSILNMRYPSKMFNGKIITEPLKYTDLFMSNLSGFQQDVYLSILDDLRESMDENQLKKFEESDSFGYNLTARLLECLNMTYPKKIIKNDNTGDKYESFFVGKSGLKEFMKFKTSLNPPIKNNFQYKNIEKYGRFFSKELLPNFSVKINTILDEILNSEGITLIYSQYIDSGIIPVCLALEESGFKRYGEKERSLFYQNKRDSNYDFDKLDVYTMKKYSELRQTSKKRQASYMVITGDEALSPKNQSINDLIKATSNENINGEIIKVILISQSGSEGLDFKNIRQVHILEPWYNRSRLEQVIGRGIRNCSHKELPLEKRNVSIYQHACILNSDINEECVDLMRYRLSEYKELKISKIKRLLKENSVDCNLNYLQSIYSSLDQTINIKLSNRQIIEFTPGDKPFTGLCDYEDTCYYTCANELDITTLTNRDLNNTSISVDYFMINSQNILEIITYLFKESSVYKIEDLINYILIILENKTKNNNIKVKLITKEDIVYLLNQVTSNQNYSFIDRYGRSGHLTNIDYLIIFTPFELQNKLEPSYAYFHKLTKKKDKFIINEKIVKASKEKQLTKLVENNINEINSINRNELSENINEYSKIIQIYNKLINRYNKLLTKSLILRGVDNIDKHFYYIYDLFTKNNNMDNSLINQLIADHLIEMLNNEEIFLLGKHIYEKRINDSSFLDIEKEFVLMREVINYFNSNLISSGYADIELEKYCVYFNINDKLVLYVLDIYNKDFREALTEDLRDFSNELIKYKEILKTNSNNIIGFISTFKKDKSRIFKIKVLNEKGFKGARCDQANKSKMIKLLNSILGSEVYNKENTKKITHIQICFLQEFYLRYYNKIRKNDKVWFIKEYEEKFI